MKIPPAIVRSFSAMKIGSKPTVGLCARDPQQCSCANFLEDEKIKELISHLKKNPVPSSNQIFNTWGGQGYLNKKWSRLSYFDQIHVKECAKTWANSNSEYSAAGKMLVTAIDSARRISFEQIL